MNKAEERARYLGYGTDPLNRAEYTANEVRDAFIDGYHEAEKDLFAQETECEGIENFVKYVPADAFIEKACEYFASHISDNSGGYERARIIEDFKKYMED